MVERPVSASDDVWDVIVVGGGIAGMTCAVGTAAEGLRVLLLEGEGVLGGRARSVTEPGTSDVLPIGPHVFLDNYANVLALLDRIGTRERIVWDDFSHLTVMDGAKADEGRLDRVPAPLHFWPALLRRPGASALEIARNLPALLLRLLVIAPLFLRLVVVATLFVLLATFFLGLLALLASRVVSLIAVAWILGLG